MRFEVWHAANPSFASFEKRTKSFPGDYRKVAVVEARDIEDVFRLTNNIDQPWAKNREIVDLPAGEHQRSTSVGDIVVMPDGKRMYCDSFGWQELPA